MLARVSEDLFALLSDAAAGELAPTRRAERRRFGLRRRRRRGLSERAGRSVQRFTASRQPVAFQACRYFTRERCATPTARCGSQVVGSLPCEPSRPRSARLEIAPTRR